MRYGEIKRKTAETDIILELNIDGKGESSIDTGCGFFDHMLTLFAKHSRFDLNIKCCGDNCLLFILFHVTHYWQSFNYSNRFFSGHSDSLFHSPHQSNCALSISFGYLLHIPS